MKITVLKAFLVFILCIGVIFSSSSCKNSDDDNSLLAEELKAEISALKDEINSLQNEIEQIRSDSTNALEAQSSEYSLKISELEKKTERLERLKNVDFSSLSYAAFGDSITYGADYFQGYAQMDSPYPSLVAESLELQSYTNFGISGSTLCSNTLGLVNMTSTVRSVTSHFDIISVMGGVNDFTRELPLGTPSDIDNSTVYGSLDMIACHLKQYYPNSFMFFMTPYKEHFNAYSYQTSNKSGYMLSDVADAVKTVAARYDIPVLDMYDLGGFEDVMYNSDCDGIHPNQDFILERTAPQIVEFILDNYNK